RAVRGGCGARRNGEVHQIVHHLEYRGLVVEDAQLRAGEHADVAEGIEQPDRAADTQSRAGPESERERIGVDAGGRGAGGLREAESGKVAHALPVDAALVLVVELDLGDRGLDQAPAP